MEPDPKELVKKYRGGDQSAAVHLIEAFYERIYNFLRRLTANDADASDLTQQTFTRFWQALPGFAERSSISSWIHSIAYHTYVDWRRKDRPGEERSSEWWAEFPAAGPLPDELAANSDLAARLYRTVEQLKSDLRATIHLHYYQGLTLQETADALEVATSTVKYRLRLGLAELQKALVEKPTPTLTRF